MAEKETQEMPEQEFAKAAPEGEGYHEDYIPEVEDGDQREGQIVPIELGEVVVADLSDAGFDTRLKQALSARGFDPGWVTEESVRAIRGQASEAVVDVRSAPPGSLETMKNYKPSTLTGDWEKAMLEGEGDDASDFIKGLLAEKRRRR